MAYKSRKYLLQGEWASRAMFFLGGLAVAAWVPLVPLLKVRFAIGEDLVGMMLLASAIGALITMPFTGKIIASLGCKLVLRIAVTALALLLFMLCLSPTFLCTLAILFILGCFIGSVDVAMNIQAVLLEQLEDRYLMSNMHAMYSLGNLAGAAFFGVMVGFLSLSPLTTMIFLSLIILAILAFFSRWLISSKDMSKGKADQGGHILALPRGVVTYIGIICLLAFCVDGTIMDWSGLLLTQVHKLDLGMATMGFVAFSAATLLMRIVGDVLVNALDRRVLLAIGILLVLSGLLMVIFSHDIFWLGTGFFIAGIGNANTEPLFFSLVGEQKDMPLPAAMSAVATLGYLGQLLLPPAMGLVANNINLTAPFVVLLLLIIVQSYLMVKVYRRMT